MLALIVPDEGYSSNVPDEGWDWPLKINIYDGLWHDVKHNVKTVLIISLYKTFIRKYIAVQP
jgi:hypothetical protein